MFCLKQIMTLIRVKVVKDTWKRKMIREFKKDTPRTCFHLKVLYVEIAGNSISI